MTLPEGESRHISKVLRLPPGAEVELLDGLGKVYMAVILETGHTVRARLVTEGQEAAGIKGIKLTVGQGFLKGKKMDTVVQKCTELGVDHFTPFWSSRCQGKIAEVQGSKKHERHVRIAESACKQCYRSRLMAIDETVEFGDMISRYGQPENTQLRLLFWEEERNYSLHDLKILDPVQFDQVIVLLGPEGGLAETEVAMARAKGWQTVSLGSRILRAETATLAAVSIVQYLMKNI